MKNFKVFVASILVILGLAQAASANGFSDGLYVFGMVSKTRADETYHYSGYSDDVSIDGWAGTIGVGKTLVSNETGTVALEADVTAGDLQSEHVINGATPCTTSAEGGCTAKADWLATLRVVASKDIGKFSPFITAGLAAGHVSGSADEGACGYVGGCGYNDTMFGSTLGIGVNYAISDRLSLRSEINYVLLGKPDFTADSVTSNGYAFKQVRVGLSYRF